MGDGELTGEEQDEEIESMREQIKGQAKLKAQKKPWRDTLKLIEEAGDEFINYQETGIALSTLKEDEECCQEINQVREGSLNTIVKLPRSDIPHKLIEIPELDDEE